MKRVQIIRDIAQNMQAFTGLQGEITATTDTEELRLHDGKTPGGFRFLSLTSLGSIFQAAASILSSLVSITGQAGLVVSHVNGTVGTVSVVGESNSNIQITNGNGASGNITIALDKTLDFTNGAGSATTVNGGTFSAGIFAGDGSGLTGVAPEFVNTVAVNVTENNKVHASNNFVLPLISATRANQVVHVFGTTGTTVVTTSGADTIFGIGASIAVPLLETLSFMNGAGAWLPIKNAMHLIGAVHMQAAATAPTGWALCNGQALSRATFSNLFALIGATYGAGDGVTTFNVPDMRGRTVVGVGAGGGLSNRVLGGIGGEEVHQLSVNELAQHNHTGTTDTQGSHNHTGATGTESAQHTHSTTLPSGSGVVVGGTAAIAGAGTAPAVSSVESATHTHPISSDGAHTHTLSINNTGANVAHNNMQPFINLNYFIKL